MNTAPEKIKPLAEQAIRAFKHYRHELNQQWKEEKDGMCRVFVLRAIADEKHAINCLIDYHLELAGITPTGTGNVYEAKEELT